MAMSLGFHIIFAVAGMGLPVLMAIAEWRWLKSRDPVDLDLAKRWAKGTAILFAVGAASGTVLSFELGLLWPRFMEWAGGIIGMPFSLEGFAFFTEAIFLGIYLYGWDRVSPRVHWAAGVIVALSGLFSGIFVVTANAWMNAPAGFDLVDGRPVNIDPIAAMLNPASAQQVLHMVLAAYVAIGFGVAAVHAFFLLRDRSSTFHRRALGIALTLAVACTPLQILSGDALARLTARIQPAKFAAMEAHYHTRAAAPIVIAGIPDDDAMHTRFGIEIPSALSLLAHRDASAVVTGLDAFPRDEWPNVRIVHWAFDLMIACGTLLLALSFWTLVTWLRRRRTWFENRALLRTIVFAGPLGFLAIEAGWIVTEVGRQPWIIYGILRTEDAVTPMPGLIVPFTTFTLLYIMLSAIVVAVMRRQFLETAPAPSGDPSRPSGEPSRTPSGGAPPRSGNTS